MHFVPDLLVNLLYIKKLRTYDIKMCTIQLKSGKNTHLDTHIAILKYNHYHEYNIYYIQKLTIEYRYTLIKEDCQLSTNWKSPPMS